MSSYDRSHESSGRSTGSDGNMEKKPAGQATSAARLPPSAALPRVSNTRLQQHTRLLAEISQCVACAAAVTLSDAFLQFARAAASTVAGKTLRQLTRLFVPLSPRTFVLLRRCEATSTAAAVFPYLRLPSSPDAAVSSSCCPLTHTTRGLAARTGRRAFPFFLSSLLFLPFLFFFLLLPPSLTPHAPLLSHLPSAFSPCPHHSLFNPSSSSRASAFSSASCSPSLLCPNFVFAAAAATGAGQRVVSPVPPVAVEGRDRQTLPTFAALREAASTADFSTWLQKVRRELHSWPELMFQEHRTSALIQLALETLQIPFTKGWGSDTFELSAAAAEQQRAAKRGTGVVAHVGTGAEPCIVLRADMDALPILEKTDVPFRSKRENIMHACGHDVHTTLLLGAAALLKAVEPQLKGTVRLIFQPAEEGGAGAQCMRQEGVLRLFPPARLVFGHHLDPELPTGVLATRKGVFFAAVTNFTIEMEGKGGHAAFPREATDAAPAVAALLQAIYSIGSREISFDTEHAGLITVTQIHGGTALNVIPPKYELGGTIRALHRTMQTRLERRLQEAADHTAAVFRCTCRVHLHPRKYPPLVNEAKATELYQQIMAEASASGKVEESRLRMGGDDFAFFLEDTPGVYAVIGSGSGAEVPGQPRSDLPLHSDYFAVDERVLSYGAALEAHLALQALEYLEKEAAAVEATAGAQVIAAAAAVEAVVGELGGTAAEGEGRAAGRDADADSTVTKKKPTKDFATAAGARAAAEVTGEANEEEESGGRESQGEEGGSQVKAKRVNSAAPKKIPSYAEEL